MSTRTTEFAAKITGDANGAIAAMERTKAAVKATADASSAANNSMASSTDVLVKNSEKAARGVASITQALYAMEAQGSARVLALGGAVGSFADLMGPGGKVVSGIAIVTASIVALFMQAKEKSKEAADAIERDVRRMASASDTAGLSRRQQQLFSGDRLFDDPNEKGNAALKARGDAIRAGGISELRKQIDALRTSIEALPKAANDGEAALIKFRRQSDEGKLKRLVDLEQQLRKEYELTSTELGRVVANEVDRTTTGFRLADEAKNAKEAAEEWKRLGETIAASSDSVAKLIRDTLSKDEDRKRNAAEEIDKETAARLRNNKQLAEQVSALLKSKEAYEQVLIQQAGANAVYDAEAKARAEGIALTKKQKDAIRAEAEETERLERAKRALLGQPAVKPTEVQQAAIEAGKYADALSQAAAAASGIAVAFGEAGRNIATLLGSTSQLLTALSRAQRAGVVTRKDSSGKSVEENIGFVGALTGKGGAAAAGAAATSALGVVGAVASIASALGVFSSDAKARAEEMKQAALRFNDALAEFVASANPQGGASEAIRRLTKELRDRMRELAEKYFGKQNTNIFDGLGIEQLTVMLDKWRQLGNFFKLGTEAGDDLQAVIESYTKLVKAAREQVLANIEDAEVRRLVAQGRTAEADALRRSIANRRELIEAEKDTTEEGRRYAAVLREVQQAEAAAAAEAERRAKIQQRLNDDNAILGGNAQERLRRGITAFGDTFFSGFFDSFDLNTREGLEGAKAAAREFYKTLAVDGISEAERPIVEALKAIFGDIDAAISELPEILDPIATALEAFNARVELFGLSIPEQMKALAKIFTGSFGDWFDSVLANVDLTTAEGRDGFKQILEDQLSAILSDGVIAEGERPLFEFIQRALGIVNAAVDEAAQEAERIQQEAADARQQRRTNAQTRVDVFGLSGLDAFNTILDGLGETFAGLLDTFDLATLDGIEGARTSLRGVFDELATMSDEDIQTKFGMTRQEVVDALLSTIGGLNGLAGALTDVAEASRSFAEQISQDFLRAQGKDKQADLNAAKANRDARRKRAQELGLGEDVLRQIDAIYDADVRKIEEKYAAAAVAATSTSAADVASTSAARTSAASDDAAARPRTRNTTLVQDFGGLSELTAQSLAGLLREVAINTGETGAIVRALTRLPTMPLSSLQFPAFPLSAGANGSTFVFSGTINVQVGAVASTGASLDEVGYETAREISKHLGKMARGGVMYLGDGRL